jgi:hypothetical protein
VIDGSDMPAKFVLESLARSKTVNRSSWTAEGALHMGIAMIPAGQSDDEWRKRIE